MHDLWCHVSDGGDGGDRWVQIGTVITRRSWGDSASTIVVGLAPCLHSMQWGLLECFLEYFLEYFLRFPEDYLEDFLENSLMISWSTS